MRIFFLLLLLFSFLGEMQAQPPICGQGAEMAPDCGAACVICDIDGFMGYNEGNQGGTAPPGYCTFAIHHMEWIGFVAGTEDISLEIDVWNCNNGGGNGLEAGIYEGTNCQNFNLVSNCETAILNGTSVTLSNNTPLTVGQYYWLVMDSNGGNACDFSVEVTNGSTNVPPLSPIANIFGPTATCPGATESFSIDPMEGASDIFWTLDGVPVGNGENVDILFPNAGTAQVCVEATSICHPSVSLCTNVNVVPIPPTEVSATICNGDCYEAGDGTQLCFPGYFPIPIPTASGCDSLVNYTIDMIQIFPTFLMETICEGDSYTVGNETFSTTGVHNVVLKNYQGCDSAVVLTLTVEPAPVEDIEATICEGEVYILGVEVYTETGLYQQVFPSYLNCDSTINLDLTVLSKDSTDLPVSICRGDSVQVGNGFYKNAGLYEIVFQNQSACDSIVFLNLSFFKNDTTALPAQICEGDSVQVGDGFYKTEGLHEIILKDTHSCDSLVLLDLRFFPNPVTNLKEEICEGGSFSVGNQTFSSEGFYQVVLTSVQGCDSLVGLDLSVVQVLRDSIQQDICDGQSYSIGPQTFSQTGEYEVTMQAASGCDSVVFLELNVIPFLQTELTEVLCQGQSYTVGNEVFDQSGTYQIDLTAAAGCDSIVLLDLTVNEVYELDLERFICEGETYQIGSEVFDQTGQYELVLTTVNGCDSTFYLDLEVGESPVVNLAETICKGEEYTLGGQSFFQQGNFGVILTAANGCDSTVLLKLTVLAPLETEVEEVICQGKTYAMGNETFAQTGIYEVGFTSSKGCDSIITLDLEVIPAPVESLSSTLCFGETITIGTEQFGQTGFYEIPLVTAEGCDSILQLDLKVFPEILMPQEVTLCNGSAHQVGNEIFDQTGQYDVVLTAMNGCDSLVKLDLTILDEIVIQLNRGICQGQTYQVGNEVFDQTGQYEVVLTSGFGCDSTVLLNLTVSDFLQTDLVENICEGQTYQVGSEEFDQTGQYQVDFITASGCDSVVFLDLTVFENPSTDLLESICEGESYPVGGEVFDQTGQYQVVLAAATGCDSTVHLDLTVMPIEQVFLYEEICDGNSFMVGNEVFTQAGTYDVMLMAMGGCDSIVTLHLSVANCNVEASVQASPTSCFAGEDGSITFSVQNGTPPFTYQWEGIGVGLPSGSGTLGSLGQTEMLNGLPGGDYQISIIGSDGFSETFNMTVGQPSAIEGAMEVSVFGTFNVPCPDDESGFINVAAMGGTPPYQYNWSNGSTQQDLTNIGAGFYEITITDANGCSMVMGKDLLASQPLGWQMDILEPDCLAPLGLVEIATANGGFGNYQFAINGGAFAPQSSFPNLPTGGYTIIMRDGNGCEKDTSIFLPPVPEVQVDLGDDLVINWGDEVQLSPTFFPLDVQFEWQGDSLSCYTCERPFIAPLEASTYSLEVQTASGCSASDELRVYVKKDRHVFVPSAFSPNDDGFNDVLMVFSGREVKAVHSFMVFSRWGEVVFQEFNFPTNDPQYGWDGRHKNELMQPAVFVWMAKVEFIDGVVQMIEGEALLIK